MAISADTVWEVRTGGSDGNGGGFVIGASGVDRSQQDAAHATLTTSSTVHTTTTQINVAVGDYTVTADDVGNILQITGGTATAGYYQITAVDVPNNRWTVDRSAGTSGQTVAGAMGGALGTPGGAAAAAVVSGNVIWVKSATYTLSTATPGKGGPVLFASAMTLVMEGYNTTRGDRAGRPILDAGVQTSVTLYSGQGNGGQQFIHLQADGNAGTGNSGFLVNNARWKAVDCVAVDCDQASAVGFTTGSSLAVFCKAQNCTTGFSGSAFKCWADACGTGFSSTTSAIVLCVASDCTGVGFNPSGTGVEVVGCVADGNGSDGFLLGSFAGCTECVATNNGGFGFNGAVNNNHLNHCASYNNTSGRTDVSDKFDHGQIILSADPWTDAANDDYSPNNTSGGGAELRGASYGIPGQTDNADISAVQHADPAGGTVNLFAGKF